MSYAPSTPGIPLCTYTFLLALGCSIGWLPQPPLQPQTIGAINAQS